MSPRFFNNLFTWHFDKKRSVISSQFEPRKESKITLREISCRQIDPSGKEIPRVIFRAFNLIQTG
ncbi:MAG: hypothetical protein Q8R79_03440, partial [Legionellaceae bacterium]|nr:hypothetical protein [Legionellaceae bacterium]